MASWEDKHYNHDCPSLPPSSPHLLLLSTVSVGVSCPSCVHSRLLAHPQPTRFGGVGAVKRETEGIATVLSSTLLCYQSCFSRKWRAQHHRGCYEESGLHNFIPARPNTGRKEVMEVDAFQQVLERKPEESTQQPGQNIQHL